MINYLRLKVSRRNMLLDVDVCCLGTQPCKTIIQKYFDDSLYSGITERPNQHFRRCATRSVHWLVKLSRPIPSFKVTWLFLMPRFIFVWKHDRRQSEINYMERMYDGILWMQLNFNVYANIKCIVRLILFVVCVWVLCPTFPAHLNNIDYLIILATMIWNFHTI